jgi:ABC-type antimicrobial peptide transport system permease subunit
MVAGEASLLALAGGVIGCVLAGALCTAIGSAMKHAPGFASVINGLSLTPFTAMLTLAIAIFIGLASSALPGMKAARTPIVDALGYSG